MTKKKLKKKELVLCINCDLLYSVAKKDLEKGYGRCPECGDDTLLVSQIPLGWVEDIILSLIRAVRSRLT